MFFIDDRTLWSRNDFNDAIALQKILSEGKVKTLRKTSFHLEETEFSAMTANVLLLNYLQADSSYPRLAETGFIDRALKIRINHSEKEFLKITREYNKHGWSSETSLPDFFMPENFFKPKDDNSIDPSIEAWINDNFKSATQKTVRLIAKVTSKEAFEDLIPLFECSLQDKEFKEVVEFQDMTNCKLVEDAIL
jgi:hypothetical protein